MTNVDLVKQLESAQLALVRCMVKAEVMLAHPSHDNTHLLNEIVALVRNEIPMGEEINVERVHDDQETVVEGAVPSGEAPATVVGAQDVSVGLTGLGGSVSGGRLS